MIVKSLQIDALGWPQITRPKSSGIDHKFLKYNPKRSNQLKYSIVHPLVVLFMAGALGLHGREPVFLLL
jgi:hypothetical protein